MAVERYVDKSDFSQVVTKINTHLKNRYTKAQTDSAIATAIGEVTQFDYEIVQSLPQSGTKGVIYLVPNSGSGSNIYDEYIWIVVEGTGSFEKVGWRDLDTSAFLVGTDVKVDGSTITKTPDQSGNGFTLSAHAATTVSDGTGIDVSHTGVDYEVSLDSATQASLALADTALQPGDVEPLTNEDLADVLAIITDDPS